MGHSVKALTIVGSIVSALATATVVHAADLFGPYQCVQNCGGPGQPFVAPRGWEMNLTNELGQRSRAWIDRPGHLWAEQWREGAVFSQDGLIVRFDRGTVWQRAPGAPGAPPVIVVPRPREVVVPAPSAYDVYQSLRRPYLCYLPSEGCDNTQRLTN